MKIGPRRAIKHQDRPKTTSRQDARDSYALYQWESYVLSDGMYPLHAFGMPLPGPNFVRHAKDFGDDDTEIAKVKVDSKETKSGKRLETKALKIGQTVSKFYLNALRRPGFNLKLYSKTGSQLVSFVPGHIWGQHLLEWEDDPDNAPKVDGPHPADVMVIGKTLGADEDRYQRNLVGPSGTVLIDMLNRLHVKGLPSWYVTNLIKFKPPGGATTIKADWLKDCLPLLHQELRIVRPAYILCLGADASKALLGPKHTVASMEGRVVEYRYPIGIRADNPRWRTALVMTVVHPAQVARDESLGRTLERGLARFNLLQQGVRFDKEETGVEHDVIDNLQELQAFLHRIETDPDKHDDVIAMDAEWHGEHPVNAGSYLRTVQLAWRPKHAISVRLNAPGGAPAFFDEQGRPAVDKALRLIQEFILGVPGAWRPKRITGHFFNADLEWLVEFGCDVRPAFRAPLYDADLFDLPEALQKKYAELGYEGVVPAWVRTKFEGGADTGLMAHAIEESANYKLETLATRYTTVPRYDTWLHEWRETYCRERGLKAGQLEGYGDCPDHILSPSPAEREKHGTLNYAAYDADATLRLYYEFQNLLDSDYDGNCCREAFWESMIATPAVLEIHRTGILVNKRRIDFLTERFIEARTKQEEKIKTWAKWPDFNIRSVQHVREFLFGHELNGKISDDGKAVRIRPKKAKTLQVQPLVDTSKPPKLWAELVDSGKVAGHSPGTNKTVLSILSQENEHCSEQINWIRDYRFLDQVLKSILRPPKTDDAGNWLYEADSVGDESLQYDAGLASVICDDGRVRTHIYQTKETGRWSSARPPLQNFSKQRDPDYKRLLGDGYRYKLRSILQASPGYVMLDIDYVGAELYGMAIMSGDTRMIDHATRNQLPETDPNFYDIHSNVAVLAFSLKCPPTKAGLAAIDKSYLRIVAKSVIFGIAYGRGAKAIAFAAKEQGVKITVAEAQQVIDTIFTMYPGLVPFFNEAKSRAAEERWLCHCFGRFRRFPQTLDKQLRGEFERQAMNFPIQGMIASAVSRAIAYLYDAREQSGDPDLFRILLQIHDAILLEVPVANLRYVAEEIVPWAMRDMVPIYPSTLDGTPTGKGPYYLGAEAEAMLYWGQGLTEEEAISIGLEAPPVWSKEGVVVKYFSQKKAAA